MGSTKNAAYERVVVFGEGGSGKSAVTIRWANGAWVGEYDPTIEDEYRKTVMLKDGQPLNLAIWDTAGREEFSVNRLVYDETEFPCAVFLYSITSEPSFREVIRLIDELRKRQKRPSILVLGNKCDLESQRKINMAEAQKMLADRRVKNFIECSAKENTNIEVALSTVVELVRGWTKAPGTSTKGKDGCALL